MDQAKVHLQSLLNEVELAEENLSKSANALIRAQNSRSAKVNAIMLAIEGGVESNIIKASAQLYHAGRWYDKKYGEYTVASAEVKQARYNYNRICNIGDTKRCVMCGRPFESVRLLDNCCSASCRMTQDYPVVAE